MDLVRPTLVQAAQMVLVLLLAPGLTGSVRKLKARLLGRQGPSIVQPYRDLWRLFRKSPVLAGNASWLFRVVPYLVFAFIWLATALVPTFCLGLPFGPWADLIAITAMIGTARFFLALSALDVGTSFGGIGASREVMIASLAEPAMLLVVFTLALVAGSTELSAITAFLLSPSAGLRVSMALALAALLLIALAENSRLPIDNPATHLELTMVHEAMILEYSGRHLALLEWAASLKLLLYFSLIGTIFVPWGLAKPGSSLTAYLAGGSFYLLKIGTGAIALAIFETGLAKMRLFRIPDFLGAALMLGLLATLLRFVSGSL